MEKNIPIYLDNQATTPIDPKVLDEMMPYLTTNFGNSSSSNHVFGWQAQEAVEIARERVADIINSNTNEIIFTSGATESINLGLKGLLNSHIKNGDHIITTNAEHTAVLDVLAVALAEVGLKNIVCSDVVRVDELAQAMVYSVPSPIVNIPAVPEESFALFVQCIVL